MKKQIILFAVIMANAIGAFAQGTLVATLTHQGETSVFYGIDALKEAYAAAQEYDVINLSGGTFNGVDIAKENLTIRGAGMSSNSEAGTTATIINSDFTICTGTTLEGIYSNNTIKYTNASNIKMIKCRLKNFSNKSSSDGFTNALFLNCKFMNEITCPSIYKCSGNFINCFIHKFYRSGAFEIQNCLIGDGNYLDYSSIYNSIIWFGTTFYSSNTTCLFDHCVGFYQYTTSSPFPSNSGSSNVNLGGTISALMEGDFVNNPTDETSLQIIEEKRGDYLGSDGTQVGMYGGRFPFDPTPTNPQISKFTVSPYSTTDGLLNVEVEAISGTSIDE